MQKLTKHHLFRNYPRQDENGDWQLNAVPDPPLRVAQGESFLIETVDTGHRNVLAEDDHDKPGGAMAGNPCTGPVYVEGIKPGDVIAISIETLQVLDHCFIGVNEDLLLDSALRQERQSFVRISEDVAHFASGLEAPTNPMYGCFGVVPARVRSEPGEHGGNMDIPQICAGNTVHVRCERDGGYFCCGDGHALQGTGEINGYSFEVSLLGQLRIEKSQYQSLDAILIETPEKFISVGTRWEFLDGVKAAVHAMSDLLAAARGITLLEAYEFVSHVGDVKLGAMWPLWMEPKGAPVPVCVHLDRAFFS